MSSPTVLAYLFHTPPAPAGLDDWMADAACQYTDPEAFFPDLGHRGSAGKKVCARCPVSAQCLQCATAHADPHGIWGGQLPRERSSLRAPMRSWAAVVGLTCPAAGGVPAEVQHAYYAAHAEEAAA